MHRVSRFVHEALLIDGWLVYVGNNADSIDTDNAVSINGTTTGCALNTAQHIDDQIDTGNVLGFISMF